jgi:hypothetical protein
VPPTKVDNDEELSNPQTTSIVQPTTVDEEEEELSNPQTTSVVPPTTVDDNAELSSPKTLDEESSGSCSVVPPTVNVPAARGVDKKWELSSRKRNLSDENGSSGQKSSQSDVVISPTAPKAFQKVYRETRRRPVGSVLSNASLASVQNDVKASDVDSGSSQSNGIISPTCRMSPRRSMRTRGRSKKEVIPMVTKDSADSPISVASDKEEDKEDAMDCDIPIQEKPNKPSGKRLQFESDHSSQSDAVISPTNRNGTERRPICRHLVAETVEAIPSTLDVEDDIESVVEPEISKERENVEDNGTADLIPPTLEPESEVIPPPEVVDLAPPTLEHMGKVVAPSSTAPIIPVVSDKIDTKCDNVVVLEEADDEHPRDKEKWSTQVLIMVRRIFIQWGTARLATALLPWLLHSWGFNTGFPQIRENGKNP